jgi:hypothetical protein
VAVDNLAGDGESDTGAGRSAPTAEALEYGEDPIRLFDIEAAPVVGDGYFAHQCVVFETPLLEDTADPLRLAWLP